MTGGKTPLKLVTLVRKFQQTRSIVLCRYVVLITRLIHLDEPTAHISVKGKHVTITCTSQGSIIPREPGKNSPDERSWKARLK